MGDTISLSSKSTPSSNSNPTPSQSTPPPMSSGSDPQTDPTHRAESPVRPSSDPPLEDNKSHAPEKDPILEAKSGEGDEEGDEEEEGECGFCLFMKGGGCRDVFIDWEKCVEEGEKNKEDIVGKCFQVTSALKKCMEEHSDYYAPILQAEKAAEAEAAKEIEKEKEKGKEGSSDPPSTSSSSEIGDSNRKEAS